MTEATRDEYDRTVQLALAAIKGHKKLGLVLKKPSAEALMAAMQKLMAAVQEKVGRGEAPPDAELDALAAAIAALAAVMAAPNTPPRRGRPKGTADGAAQWAFGAAYFATAGSGLTNYRNSASGHRMTRCDALAEAMHAANFTSLTTYDAATVELKSWQRRVKRMTEVMTRCDALAEAANAAIFTSLATYDAATVRFGSIWRSPKRMTEIANALAEAMNAANFTSLTTYDAATAGLGSIWRSSKCTAEIMTRRDARAEAANAAIITSLTTYDALAEAMNAANYTSLTTYDAAAVGLGSIWRNFKRMTEIANAMRRSEDSFSGLEKLAKAMSAATQLSPQIIDWLKSAAKTKR